MLRCTTLTIAGMSIRLSAPLLYSITMCGILNLPFGCGRFRSIQYSKPYAGNTISLYGPKDKTMAKVEDLAASTSQLTIEARSSPWKGG